MCRPRPGAALAARAYAGQVAMGAVRVGDPVLALPSGQGAFILVEERSNATVVGGLIQSI